MKKNIYSATLRSYAKRMAVATAICGAFLSASAQTVYYSNFASPTGMYNVTSPSGTVPIVGGGCTAPSFTNQSNIADANLNNYATLGANTLVNLLCDLNTANYVIKSQINLPQGLTAVPAGYYAGYQIAKTSLLNLSIGTNDLDITTLDAAGNVVESKNAASLLGLGLLQGGNPSFIYFQSTQPFSAVQLTISKALVGLDVTSATNIYYAYAATVPILPVKLTSFSAVNDGKGARLSWTSATEANVSHYELERSATANGKFEKVISVNAKGNTTSATSYSVTDNAILNSEYFYRLKMVDKDGLYEYSKVVSIKNLVPSKYKIYPTLLSKGENIKVAMDNSGMAKSDIQLTNLQGQVIKTISTTDANVTIATGNLTSGVYVLKLYRNGQLATTEKLVIQ